MYFKNNSKTYAYECIGKEMRDGKLYYILKTPYGTKTICENEELKYRIRIGEVNVNNMTLSEKNNRLYIHTLEDESENYEKAIENTVVKEKRPNVGKYILNEKFMYSIPSDSQYINFRVVSSIENGKELVKKYSEKYSGVGHKTIDNNLFYITYNKEFENIGLLKCVTYVTLMNGFEFPNDCAYLFTKAKETLKCVDFKNVSTGEYANFKELFASCVSLRFVNFTSVDTSKVVSMESMFRSCNSLVKVNFAKWGLRTDNCSTFRRMFAYCKNLKEINMSNTNLRSLENIEEMCSDCSKLEKIDLNIDDIEGIKFKNNAFSGCTMISPELKEKCKGKERMPFNTGYGDIFSGGYSEEKSLYGLW